MQDNRSSAIASTETMEEVWRMTDQNEMPEYVARNRAVWDRWGPGVGRGRRTKLGPLRDHMGTWATLESQVGIVSEPKRLDAIELGCGTGCVSARLVRLGARPVGIDNSAKQLETARRPQAKHSLDLALLHGNAEAVPYPDASFD